MTTVHRLRERAKETFHVALEDSFRNGRWNPVLRDAYENAESDLAWEEAELERAAVMDAIADRDGLTEAEARAMAGDR